MKRFLCLICIILLSCRLTWAQAYGESEAGTQSSVTYTHEADCDSAHIDFGYDGDGGADSLNFYVTVDLLPCFSGDGTILTGEGLELDSIGGHVFKVTYFLADGDAVADGYVAGLWLNKNPSSGDTIQREASTHGATDVATLWGDTLNQLLITVDSIITASGFDADTTLLTFLRYIRNNQSDYKATGFSTHGASDVATLWGDTLNQLLVTIDSVIAATGFDPDSTLLAFLRYVRNNQADYKATGFSTFDHTSDNVTLVDSSAGDISIAANRVIDFTYFWGACDECYFRAYPEGGQANKDSLIIIDPSLGADSLVAKIIYKHGTVSAVCDTAYFYKSPWW